MIVVGRGTSSVLLIAPVRGLGSQREHDLLLRRRKDLDVAAAHVLTILGHGMLPLGLVVELGKGIARRPSRSGEDYVDATGGHWREPVRDLVLGGAERETAQPHHPLPAHLLLGSRRTAALSAVTAA
jgi:hypothetical protein